MRILRELPIRAQLLALAVSTIVVVVIIIFISYYDSLRAFNINTREYSSQLLSQNQGAITSKCDQISRIIYNIAYNTTIQDFLLESDPVGKLEISKAVDSFIFNIKDMNEGIIDIKIFSNDEDLYNILGKSEEEIASRYYSQGNRKVYFSELKNYSTALNKYTCFMAAIKIYFSGNTMLNNIVLAGGTEIGSVVVIFDGEMLGSEFSDTSSKSMPRILLSDRENRIYSSNIAADTAEEAELLKHYDFKSPGPQFVTTGNERYILMAEDLPPINGRIISIISEREMFSDLVAARQKALWIFFVAILLLIGPFLFVISNIVDPLKKFINYMSSIKSGNLKKMKNRVELKGYAEIKVVADEFNSMLSEIDSLTRRLLETNTRLYENELEKKQFELALLQSQINPHFLYNTLESIKGMALSGNSGKIGEMAQALGQILRYSIKGADIVTVFEELNIVKAYIQIQQTRFLNRFEVAYDFTCDVLECQVPRMILQPFVENAIFYGLEPKTSKGHLSIEGRINESEHIEICIKDNGMGIDSPKLEEIRKMLSENAEYCTSIVNNNNSIGINNVNNRIRLIFGTAFGVKINSDTERGTEVILTMPARRNNSV